MNFELTDQHTDFRKLVREFAQGEIAPKAFDLNVSETFDVDLTQHMGELGLFGCLVSPEYGGQGMDVLSYIICVEELARVDGSQAATVAAGNSLGITPIDTYGSEDQKRTYLPDLCQGRKLWGFGLTEPEAGSDAGATQTKAVHINNSWRINGSKIFITNGSTPITWGSTVQCVTGPRHDGKPELTCFLVRNGTPGFTTRVMKHKMTWRASNTSELFFDEVNVTQDTILGGVGEGFRIMLSTLDGGRLSIAAMAVGGAQGAYEAALSYAKTRKQFSKPIAHFQAIAFKLADMATDIEAARNLLYKACWLKEQRKPYATEAAMAKLFAGRVFKNVAHECVQIHGGYGLMEEYPAARFYRDQRLLEIGEGTNEVQQLVIARSLGCFDHI